MEKVKKNGFILVIVLIFGLSNLYAQNSKKEQFKVKGNCSMCETRIEKAAKSVAGVDSADWNVKTKLIVVTFQPNVTDLVEIHNAISKAGYDTEKVKAKQEDYEKLPKCCKYER
ncbi:MAG: heavy-metal-associated domain-containing protein [Bacteroidales bacterium]|nr:heavy-metal-associated domain-containing protein [Bacteroidales bacterium]